jgi:hypothetical protein
MKSSGSTKFDNNKKNVSYKQLVDNTNENEDWSYDLTKHFNLTNAKKLSTILVMLFIFYHGFLNTFYGKKITLY